MAGMLTVSPAPALITFQHPAGSASQTVRLNACPPFRP
jgi:hypothetical protein